MKPDISFFLGGIRDSKWTKMYKSMILAVGKYQFELVLCGPTQLPDELLKYRNIKYIRDFGSCARAAQIAALNCESSLITLSADDGVYMPNSIEKAIDLYRAQVSEQKYIIGLRYEEGGNEMHTKQWYWSMWNHDTLRLHGIPIDTPMSLNSIIPKDLFMDIGGYDCTIFETCNWGGHDLMIRLHKYGVYVIPFSEKNLVVEWAPGETEEHRPIYLADYPPEATSNYHKFREIYSIPNNRIKIDPYNWINSESVWSKRFK